MDARKMYSEVYVLILNLSKDLKSKIPQKILNVIIEKKDNSYNPEYNSNLKLYEQNFSREAMTYLVSLVIKYCDDEQKKKDLLQIITSNKGDRNNG